VRAPPCRAEAQLAEEIERHGEQRLDERVRRVRQCPLLDELLERFEADDRITENTVGNRKKQQGESDDDQGRVARCIVALRHDIMSCRMYL
jgi:hypothetical protein